MNENKAIQISLPYISEDMLIQILKKLSLKFLAKAIFVSKHWNSLILNSVSLTKPKILFTSNTYVYGSVPLLVSSMDTQSHVEKVSLPNLILNRVILLFEPVLELKLSVLHGLVLVELGKFVYLWNPLTKYSENVTLSVRPDGYVFHKLVLGLCYDSKANKYKVVVAEWDWETPYIHAFVWVVSSTVASCVTVYFGYSLYSLVPGPVLNGYLHSIGDKTNQHGLYSHGIIIAFDPTVDLFSDVAMPDPRAETGNHVIGLGVLGGCLCMARLESPKNNISKIEILIMKEYGVGISWVVTCSIRNVDNNVYIRTLVPLCYNNDGQPLVHVNGCRVLMLNISKSCLEEVGSVRGNNQHNAVFYEENWCLACRSFSCTCRTIVCGLRFVGSC